MFISKEMIKDFGYGSVEEFILDQNRSHKIRIRKFTAEGVDFDYDLDSGGTDDGKLYLSKKSEFAKEIFEEIGKILRKYDEIAERDKSEYGELIVGDIGFAVAELKKKYTEGET